LLAADENVRLDDEPLAGGETVFPVAAGLDDGHGRFVAGDGGVVREVAAADAGMFVAGPDQLDVGEAEAEGVDADEDFVVTGVPERQRNGFSVASEIFESCAAEFPGQVGVREFVVEAAVSFEGVGHGVRLQTAIPLHRRGIATHDCATNRSAFRPAR
jgi:hypothetical protein